VAEEQSASPQIRGLADLADEIDQPFNLIVSARTTTVSAEVQRLVAQTGGTILRYNPTTNTLSPWP
jgi:hypothetical protein